MHGRKNRQFKTRKLSVIVQSVVMELAPNYQISNIKSVNAFTEKAKVKQKMPSANLLLIS
jgi:hypothetical protein